MRFFEEQEKARVQTLRLLVLFGLAVIALVLAVNAALALTWRVVSPGWSGYPAYFFHRQYGRDAAVCAGWLVA